MNIFEVADTLPNGFHDAEVEHIAIDFSDRTAILLLSIWVGDEVEREAYRSAVLRLEALEFCIFDPPDPSYPFQAAAPLTVDLSRSDPTTNRLSSTGTPFRFWVAHWNAFMHFSAATAVLEWRGASTIGRESLQSSPHNPLTQFHAYPPSEYDSDAKCEFPDDVHVAYAVCSRTCGNKEFVVDGQSQVCQRCGKLMFRTEVRKYELAR